MADDIDLIEDTIDSDDASIRRSKRTPIPKRSFALIDDYSGEELLYEARDNENCDEFKQDLKMEQGGDEVGGSTNQVYPLNEDAIIAGSCGEANDSSAIPKKTSGRPRKPKVFEDCVTPSLKKSKNAGSPVDKKAKVMAKLAAYANTQVKEEKIVGKDNEEYVYRNVFVPEIIEGSRRRKSTQKKNENDLESLKLASKLANNSSKKAEQSDPKPKKRNESKLKLDLEEISKKSEDCSASPAPSDETTTNTTTATTTSSKKKRPKKDKSAHQNESKAMEHLHASIKKEDNETPPRKRKSLLDFPLESDADLIAAPERTDQIDPNDLYGSCSGEKSVEVNAEKPREIKHAVKILKKRTFETGKREGEGGEGGVQGKEEKKHVKWDDKDQVKIYERDPPEPTLVDTIKERRKKKGLVLSSGDYDNFPELSDQNTENRGTKKRKLCLEDLPSLIPKLEEDDDQFAASSETCKSEKPSKKKRKHSGSGDLSSDSMPETSDAPPRKKKQKIREEISEAANSDREEAPIVLTFKSADISHISPVKKKEQKIHTHNKVSTKLSKKGDQKKEKKKQNKKNKNKLIVSFKGNQFQPKKKKAMMKEEQDSLDDDSPSQDDLPASGSSSPEPLATEPMPSPPSPSPPPEPTEDLSPEDEEVKHKKKNKKKSKNKLKKDERIVSTESFDVLDKVITRVKKKKIYKKRNQEKVLVRIVKNHCNRNGDVVKTETIAVDEQSGSVNQDEKAASDDLETLMGENSIPKIDIKQENITPEKCFPEDQKMQMQQPDIKVEEKPTKKAIEKKGTEKKAAEKKGTEKKATEKKSGKRKVAPEKKVVEEEPSVEEEDENDEDEDREDSPEYFPSLRKEFSSHAKKRKANFKHSLETSKNLKTTAGEKRPLLKKGQKLGKKSLSRPANKNVTVGGKVVGKTTKGMKKTGDGGIMDQPPKISSFDALAQDPPNQLPQVTEPKNVYNFFCRKYRPMVVRQFPKADFSEISRRLAAIWKSFSDKEKQEHRDKFEEIHSVSQQKLAKLGRVSPTQWSETDLKFIKKNIGENDTYQEVFSIPKYPVKRLAPIDMAAHLALLGDSLNMISSALQQQSSMTVHGAMSVLLDSILSAIAPLVFFTSHVPEMKAIDDSQQARILDNLSYILPGL